MLMHINNVVRSFGTLRSDKRAFLIKLGYSCASCAAKVPAPLDEGAGYRGTPRSTQKTPVSFRRDQSSTPQGAGDAGPLYDPKLQSLLGGLQEDIMRGRRSK
jgi:hypothetical protein